MRYRVHFLIDIDEAKVRAAWTASVRYCRELGVLPETMYETGQSKRIALQNPVNLGIPKPIDSEVDRFLAAADWAEFVVSKSLWADADQSGSGYKVDFGTGYLGSGDVPVMQFLVLPDSQAEVFEAHVSELETRVGLSLVICRFIGKTPKVEAVWDRATGWIEYNADVQAVRAVIGRTGFDY